MVALILTPRLEPYLKKRGPIINFYDLRNLRQLTFTLKEIMTIFRKTNNIQIQEIGFAAGQKSFEQF